MTLHGLFELRQEEKYQLVKMTAGFQLGVIGSLALSVASSVAIVICNKALISTLGFPFG
jgi:solute carrier family 35, member E3